MYIQLRLWDSISLSSNVKYKCKSINQSIEDIKRDCFNLFKVPQRCKVRLFCNGKELADFYTLLDYDIKINDILQVFIHKDLNVKVQSELSVQASILDKEISELTVSPNQDDDSLYQVEHDEFYKVGDHVDCQHSILGAWFEASVYRIYKSTKDRQVHLYDIKFARSSLPDIQRTSLDFIRPPSTERVAFIDLKKGDMILVNYNLNDPSLLGYWYNFMVKSLNRKRRTVSGTIFVGCELTIEDQIILNLNLLKIVENTPRNNRSDELNKIVAEGSPIRRPTAAECLDCNDDPEISCFECACCKCGQKEQPEKQIVCDECNKVYHFWCHPSLILELPPDEWYCYACKNCDQSLIQLKEEQKLKKRRKYSPSSLSSVKPNWGRGISCVGRSRINEAAPKNHFGSIPGVQVGTWWRFRFQASEAGVHTPLVAGIHGKESIGAFSIVFSCGYEDDVDLGDEIYYTGSGGRDSGESKCRVGGPQVKDQQLKRCNKALAMNCAAPFSEIGANAGQNWRAGKPVRVLRSGNARGATKKSRYLPKLGVRYDGLYKVVRYWPERKASGFLVWRYLLRRDDHSPAPWTKQGKQMMRKTGVELINPPGYEELDFKVGKRKISDLDEVKSKKRKPEFKLSEIMQELIKEDSRNAAVWTEVLKLVSQGEKSFVERVKQFFKCPCCLETVSQPITTFCNHNICKECYDHSLASLVTKCPICRANLLRKARRPLQNHVLSAILCQLLGDAQQILHQ